MDTSLKLRILSAHVLIITLWASAYSGIRVGLGAYSPEHLSLLRLLVGSIALLIFAVIIKMRLPEIKDIPMIFILGGLGFAVYQTALNYGGQTVSAGAISLIVSTIPIFSAILAFIFYKEGFGIRGWIGTMIAFFGVIFVSIGPGDTMPINFGVFFILVASLATSIFFVFQKKYLKKYGFIPFTTYTIFAGTLIMFFQFPGLGEEIVTAPMNATLSVIYLGLFPTVLPYFALAYITSHTGASAATSSLYLTPVLSFLIAWIWLGEVPTLFAVLGGVITLIGVLVVNLKIGKKEQQPPPAKITQEDREYQQVNG